MINVLIVYTASSPLYFQCNVIHRLFDYITFVCYFQNESNSGQGVNFIELGGERRLNERVRDKQQRTKRKSFDIHDYIEQFEASDNTEETDDDSHTYIKDKSFYCDTVLFDNNDMELTCKVIGEFADHPSQIESDVGALSKSFVASEVNCDKENEIHVNHSWLEDANRQGHTTENASKRNQFNNQEAVGETTNGNKSICDSENWYRGMLEKASKTCNFKAPANDLSLIGEETEMQDLKSHHEMLRGIMEQLSVKNARIEPGVDNNRQPDSIIPILRREASQAVENQYIEGNDLDRTDKMMELPTPAMIGQVREGSAIHVLPPTKRAKLEADVAKEGNINDLGGNNAILTKEQSIFLPPATNDEQNSFQNEDKENVLPPILVRNSTLSSMSQSSIDNKEMLRGIMEQLSVKNARIEPRVEQNRQPDSIISILRREASQVVENQFIEGNDLDRTDKMMEPPTPAMIGQVREGSAFHVLPPTKRAKLEADVAKEGNINDLGGNNAILTKEQSIFLPPATNDEQNSFQNEDKENVLPPILVRNSTLSSMSQSSIDNKEMLRGIMEQLSVKNARIEPRVEQNRQPDSIISILRREASQVVENQVLDGNDMDQTEKIIELPTPAMIGQVREGSAFHVPLPTKRVRLEADVTKEGNKSELDRNNSITIKEKSLFVPPATNDEQNSFQNEDKENVLPPILVRNSTISSMPQSSIDNKGSQDFDNNIKVQNEDSDKESLPQSILKQNANFHDVEHDAIFEDRNNSSFNSRAVDGIDVSSNAMQNEVQCDNVNMAYSLQTNQLILESQNGTVVLPDATQTNQEHEVVRTDKEELLPAAKANIYEGIGI